MYGRGKQRLDELDGKLATLRAEARSGYGKDEVRRNRIKADLQADRLAKEKQMRDRLNFLTSSNNGSSSTNNNNNNTSALKAGAPHVGATTADLDVEERAQRPLAPYEHGDVTSDAAAFLLFDGDDGDASASAGDARHVASVVGAMQNHVEAYKALLALAEDYDYDAQLETKLKQVQDRDKRTGLPSVLVAPHADGAGTFLDGPAHIDAGPTSASEVPPQETRTRTVSSASAALSLDANLYSVPRPSRGKTSVASTTSRQPRTTSRTGRGSVASASTVKTQSAAPVPRPPRAALSTQGTAVAVSYGQSQVRALQKMVRQKREMAASLATDPSDSRRPTTAGTATPSQLHSMWVPLTETVSRVVRPATVAFCPTCAKLVEHELVADETLTLTGTESEMGTGTSQSMRLQGRAEQKRTCPHCHSEVSLETKEAWWAAPVPAAEPTLPPASSLLTRQSKPAVANATRAAGGATAVSGGTDSMDFPEGEDDDGPGSFQAALAEVRAAMAASKAKSAPSTGTTASAAVSAGTETEAAPSSTPAELARSWSESLKGVFLMHLWDSRDDAA